MRKTTSFLILIAAVIAGSTYFLMGNPSTAAEVMLYKNPQCGCCENYADYLRENGFSVVVKPTHELTAMSRDAGIPDEVQGCHLAMIEGYVVSGHVPIRTVNKLLTERPQIAGVTLPGMPLGSPGMSGPKAGPFEILEISKLGEMTGIYSKE